MTPRFEVLLTSPLVMILLMVCPAPIVTPQALSREEQSVLTDGQWHPWPDLTLLSMVLPVLPTP